MKAISSGRVSDSCSDNRKSNTCTELRRSIQNRKWLGLFPIVVAFMVCGVKAEAQQATKMPRIGYLNAVAPSTVSDRIEAFRQGLRELGYIEGNNIVIEWRSPEGKPDRMPTLAAELVRLKVDVIVTGGSGATGPVKEATVTIPIVMAQDDDPVASAFVASLARPGGNITGLSTLAAELSGKRLELLKEIVPMLSRVTVFVTSTSAGHAQSLRETELAAEALGVKLQYLDVLVQRTLSRRSEPQARDRLTQSL